MAVVIRLARFGRRKRPFYRIVVADKEMPRNGRFLELVGTRNPLVDPPVLTLKEDRVKHWIGLGAQPSDTVADIIEKVMPGYLKGIEDVKLEKIRSVRAKRKARSGSHTRQKPKNRKRTRVAKAATA